MRQSNVLRAATVAVWVGVGVLALLRVRVALDNPDAGLDLRPLRGAAQALLDGRSVYRDPLFVYPPTAAPVFLPTSLGSFAQALEVWLSLAVVAIVASVVLAVAQLRGRWWPVLAGGVSGLLLVADVSTDSLLLGNLSLFMPPLAVGVLLSFERQRWIVGCALLATSLLLKPILAPLLLLPILRRQWRALLIPAGPAIVLLIVATIAVPGAENFSAVLRHLARGSQLTGDLAVYNLSLRGLGERLDAPDVFLIARVVVAAAGLVGVAAWYRRAELPGATAAAGASILLGVFLAGSLSENHYLIIAVPCLLLGLTLRREMRLLLWAVPGLALLLLGHWGTDGSSGTVQVHYVLGEVLLLTAAVGATVTNLGSRGRRSAELTAAQTRAIEARAVDLATRRLKIEGWSVDEAEATDGYDLRCERGPDRLYVQVKGTTGPQESVSPTPEEARSARSLHPQTALIVVSEIRVWQGDHPTVGGGTLSMISPWRPDARA